MFSLNNATLEYWTDYLAACSLFQFIDHNSLFRKKINGTIIHIIYFLSLGTICGAMFSIPISKAIANLISWFSLAKTKFALSLLSDILNFLLLFSGCRVALGLESPGPVLPFFFLPPSPRQDHDWGEETGSSLYSSSYF